MEAPLQGSHAWRLAALPGVELMRMQSRRGFPLESHEACSFGVTVLGAERLRVGATQALMTDGDISLVNSGELHGSVVLGGGIALYRGFVVDRPAMARWCGELGMSAAPDFRVPVVRDASLQKVLHRLHSDFERPMSGLEASSRWLAAVGALLSRYGGCRAVPSPGKERKAVASAREIIDAHLAEELTLGGIASQVGLTAYALAQAFRRSVGLSPHAYQTMRRVAAARELLKKNQPPAEVAGAVGFFDQSHLNRHFKKYTGVTSARYRRSMAAA